MVVVKKINDATDGRRPRKDLQLPGCLPHVVQVQNVRVIDQFHYDNLPLNAE